MENYSGNYEKSDKMYDLRGILALLIRKQIGVLYSDRFSCAVRIPLSPAVRGSKVVLDIVWVYSTV